MAPRDLRFGRLVRQRAAARINYSALKVGWISLHEAREMIGQEGHLRPT